MEPQPRKLRTRPSIADESGGEEILYPRNIIGPLFDLSSLKLNSDDQTPKVARLPDRPSLPNSDLSLSPPSAFNQISRRARKRTSDEFEFDQSGSLVSKPSGSGKDKAKDDKMTTRRHRSLNVSISSAKDIKGKDRRRDSATLTITSNLKVSSALGKTLERDAKQPSAGSTSSNVSDAHHQRRGHTTDYSHLPPSPSSSSIQHFLRHSGATAPSQPSLPHSSSKDNLQSHPPPSVAHSLLRGTQEGWSALDDEALRKLDGLTGKGARARASVGSFGRPSSSSRPGTPASKSGSQWEGLSTSDSGKCKRASGSAKDNASIKDKIEQGQTTVAPATSDPQGTEELSGWTAPSSDEQQSHSVVPDTTPKKSNSASARLSFTPKRGSTSSTTYTSTPSSRDSAFMSAATSVTSMSAASGRHSSSKGRRNSASSDISVHSVFDVKDRVAFLAVNGDPVEDGAVPPVPPLPKDLSTFRSPPITSSALAFPSIPSDDKVGNHDNQLNRTISLEVPNYLSPLPSSSSHRESQQYPSNAVNMSVPVIPKTPSKKWSFSSALNLKISSSPSSASSQKSTFPLSPRSVTFGQQLRKSTSKDKPMSSSSSKGPWSPKQPDAMASAGSLVSLSSVGSVKTPAQATNFSKTPERNNTVSSRPGTGSSVSTNHTTSALAAPSGRLSPTSSVRRSQSKRLTPSSIPFFRRSSSQSMQLPAPLANGAISATSPTLLSMLSTSGLKQRTSPPLDCTSPSVSTPGTSHKKHSVLSLGLPSLLKSSSRRSLHSDAKDAAKDAQKAKDAARELEKGRNKLEKERQKKEDKERSESRISMIMNRKRGKVFEI
jgi:dual specificity tyrosine-phosphorylation-regulated kinase 2/3/4